MNAFAGMESFLSWLVNHSLQAGALVLFVLLLQRIFRRQLTHHWRFALWWIVLARLVLPIGPESAVSVFNFFRPAVILQKPGATAAPRTPAPPEDRAAVPPEKMPWQYERPAPFPAPEPVRPEPVVITPAHPAPARPALSLASGLALLWLAGVLVLSGGVLIQLARFQVRLRRAVAPPPPHAAELLEACRREFAVTRRLTLLETDLVRSPALFGLFRLRLLLPRGLAGRFNATELRYIFLHELAHVKRGDLWLNWLVTALQIMHWFNPLIWFGFARLRADRELGESGDFLR
jgi:bla regulator protein BlaR1